MDSCKVSRAAGAVPTRFFTPLHTPVHSDFFAKMCESERHRASAVAPSAGLQGRGGGADRSCPSPHPNILFL